MLLSSAAFSQTITLKGRSLTFSEIFSAIQKQTGYRTSGKLELLDSAKPLAVNVKDIPLEDFLTNISKDQVFNCAIVERNIIISPKVTAPKKDKATAIQLQSAPIGAESFKGKVTDEKGKAISGVNITLKDNSRIISVSDPAGNFSIPAAKGQVLQLSHIAFTPRELPISLSLIQDPNIHLIAKEQQLQEVSVNKGYYSTTRALNTGNVASITAEDIEKQPVSNLLQALQSRIPGLSIVQQSGNPGSNFTIELRGKNSLNQSNPLFIVDGIPFSAAPMGQIAGNVTNFLGQVNTTGEASAAGAGGLSPLNSINPEDIESIDVLKDADATAIYGSLGANGVILITTKKGKAGPMRISGRYSAGFSSPARMPEFLSTTDYLRYRRAVLANDGKKPGATDYDLNGTWDTTRYTQWGKELIGRQTVNTNASVSLSGGSNQVSYSINIGHNQISPPYEGDFSDKRTTLGFNISSTSIDNRFRMIFSGNYSHDANTLPGLDISSFLSLPPNAPDLLTPDGKLNWWNPTAGNPYASLMQRYNALTRNIMLNGNLSYEPFKGLVIRANIGYSDVAFSEQRLNPLASLNPGTPGVSASSLTGNSSNSSWILEPQAEYSRKLGAGKLTVLAGTTFQELESQGTTINAIGFASDAMLGDLSAASRFSTRNRYSKYRYNALFGRINYTLLERYVFNLTGRRDGSSRFGPGKQFGNFGAIGAAWVFGREPWINQAIPLLSFGKLRFSYGITGNDQIGDYRYLDSYSANNAITYLGTTGLFPTRVFNDDYRWESNRKFESAIELGFFQDRLMLSTSWYRNRSSNQLVSLPLAPTTGNTTVQANLNALIQNTGLELQLSSTNIKSADFSWRTSFNLSLERNKLLAFPDLATSPYRTKYVLGRAINISEPLFKLIGVNPQTGLYEFMGADGKPTSSPNFSSDVTERVELRPDYYGGMGNNLHYKNLELDIQLQFVKQQGRNILFNTLGALPFSNPTNLPGYFLDNIWLKPGDIATLQRLSSGGLAPGAAAVVVANNAVKQSDGAYSDASYLRLKNISFSYKFGEKVLKKVHLKQLRAFAQAQNLLTLTRYKGFDPESQGSLLPPLRTVVFGANLTL
jgi:TonB-linked SusC/RagA family outer membrane protein